MAEKITSSLPKPSKTNGVNTPAKEEGIDLFMSAVCGSLASFIFDKQNINSPNALLSLLSEKPKIYSVINESIDKSCKNFAKNIKDNIKVNSLENCIKSLNKSNIETLNSISASISTSISAINDSINEIYDILEKNISTSEKKSENNQNSSTHNFVEYVSNTEKQFSLLIQNLIEHQIKFNDVLSNSLNKFEKIDYKLRLDLNLNGNLDISSILEGINKIDNVKNEDINSIKDSINSVLKLYKVLSDISNNIIKANIDIASIENGIKQLDNLQLNKLINILNNVFNSISLDNIKKITINNKDIETIKTSTDSLLTLYKSLSDINEKIIKSNIDITSIENNIQKLNNLKLNKLTETLNKLFGSVALDKEIKANIESISKGFEILLKVLSLNDIEKVVAISNKDMRLFKKQIKKIGNVYLTAVSDLITTINDNNFPTLKKEVIESLKQTFSIINYVTSLGVDIKELNKLENTLDYLNIIIEEDLVNLLNTIKSDKVKTEINSIIKSKLFEKINIVFDNISDIYNHTPKYKDIFSLIAKLTLLNGEMILLKSFINTLSSINNITKAANNLQIINEKILTNLTVDSSLNLKDLFINFASIYKSSKKIDFDALKDSSIKLIDIIILFENINVNKDIDKVGIFCSGLSKTLLYFALVAPFVPLAKIGLAGLNWCIDNIVDVVNKLKDVDMSNLQNIMVDFTKVVAISGAILIAGALFMSYIKIPDLIAFTVCLGGFIAGTIFAYSKSIKDIKKTIEIAQDFGLLIAISGGVLIAGGIFMKMINIGDLFAFAATLGVFIMMISKALSYVDSSNAFANAKDLGLLIAISGGILIAGGLFMKSINVMDLLAFAGTLAVFIGLMCAAYSIPSLLGKWFKKGFNPIQKAEEFALLVAVSGAILIAGGLFMKIINLGELWDFTLALGAFIIAVCAAYSIPSLLAKWFGAKFDPIQNAEEFALLIAVSGGILIAGGLFMKIINLGELWDFTLVLGAFIIAVCAAYSIPSLLAKWFGADFNPMLNAKEFTLLVAVSGAILIAGGLFMKIINYSDLITFTVTLGAFIFVICRAYGLAGKMMKKSKALPNAYALAVLTAVAGATLLIGGYLLMENPGLDVNVAIFCTILTTYIGAMSIIIGLLSKVGKSVWAGIAAIGGIVLVTYMAAKVIEEIKEVVGEGGEKYWMTIIQGIGSIAVILVAVAGLSVAAGAFAMGPLAAFFWTGLAALGVISGIAILAAQAVKSIADAMKDINSVKNFDVKGILTNINDFIKIVDALEPLEDKAWMITKVSFAMTSMGIMMSTLSNAVKNYATMTVPEFDANGRPTGKKIKLNNTHFKEAADNVKLIIQTLGGAIIDSYNSAPPGMFESTGFLGLGDTPFAKVSKSMSTMGPMLLTLAEAVKDYASLTIPVYDNKGQKIGVRSLSKPDFEHAAENVSIIVTTLGGAIVKAYENAENNTLTKGMFDPSGWLGKGDSPFAKVTKALSTMGPMLSSISKGVKDYADLRINIYDNNGKVTGSREMTPLDFVMASFNVGLIVSTLGKAVAKVYNDNPSMFILNQNSNPMLKVAQACTEMGKMISSISEGVLSYANMEIPVWGTPQADGTMKKIGVKKVDPAVFKEAADTITTVITTMGEGIMGAFNEHPEWFKGQTVKIKDGGWFGTDEFKETGSTLFDKVISGCSQMANLITTVGTSVLMFAGGEIAEIKNGKPTGKYVKVGPLEIAMATLNVSMIFSTFGNILKTISESKLFEDIDEVESIKSAIDSMIALVSQSGEAIQNFGKLDLSNVIDTSLNIDKISQSLMTIAKLHNLLFEDDEYITGMFTKWTYKETFFNELDSHSNNDVKNLKNALSSLNSIVSQINKINTSLSDNLNNSTILDTKKIEQMCSAFNTIKTQIDSLFSNNDEVESSVSSSIGKLFKKSDESETNKKFKLYLNSIEDFVELGNETNQNTLIGWQNIGLGLMTINTIVSTISDENHNKLKEHVDSIDKYVTKINSLDMSKVNSLTSLVQALNLLAFKMGNIDNLTEALSQKLSSVLNELTKQLKEADKSINKAHKLQDARKKAIEESVNKIKEIMGQTLNVEISKKDEDDSTISSGGGSTAIQSGENKSSSNSNTTPVAEIDSSAASYNRVEEQGKKAKQMSNGSNVSTEVAKAISTVFGSGVKAKINNKEVILTT